MPESAQYGILGEFGQNVPYRVELGQKIAIEYAITALGVKMDALEQNQKD